MTTLLLKFFIKDPDAPASRKAVGRFSGTIGILCNLLLFSAKLVIGLLSGSVSITADAMNNLSDTAGSVVTLIGFKLAEQPADEKHPYGHARYEYLSGLTVACMILIIGFEFAKSSVTKIIHPERVEFSAALVIVLALSIVVKLWLCLFNRTLGKKINSQTLLAASADSRNDCIATSAVLLAAVIEHFSDFSIDGFIGLAVSLFILYSGFTQARETVSPLIGEGASEEMRELIVDYVSENPKVLGYHDLMVHDYGPGQRFASLHVEMDKNEDPLYCHELIDDMERECLDSHGIHLVIHYDPIVTDDPELTRMHHVVDTLLKTIDPRLKTHDFRMVAGDGHTNLIFDVTLPTDLRSGANMIKSRLDEALHALEHTTYYTVITFDAAVSS